MEQLETSRGLDDLRPHSSFSEALDGCHVDSKFESDRPPTESATWLDITAFLPKVSDELAVGQMIHGENFNLFEAMTALEIMDPKMDAGMNMRRGITVEEAIASGLLPTDPSLSDVIAICDRLLASEMTWHGGGSLPQTIFSCVYPQRPDIITDRVLLAYIKCLLKSCELVRRMMMRSDVHEEEDLITNTFGYGLCEDTSDEAALAFANQVEEHLQSRIRALKKSAGAGTGHGNGPPTVTSPPPPLPPPPPPAINGTTNPNPSQRGTTSNSPDRPNSSDTDTRRIKSSSEVSVVDGTPNGKNEETDISTRLGIELSLLEALTARIRYRRAMLSLYMQLDKRPLRSVESAKKSIAFARAQIPLISDSLQLASANPPGFDPAINRRPVPLPPLPKTLLNTSDALAKAESLLTDLLRVFDIGQLVIGGASTTNPTAGMPNGAGAKQSTQSKSQQSTPPTPSATALASTPIPGISLKQLQEYVWSFASDCPSVFARGWLFLYMYPDSKPNTIFSKVPATTLLASVLPLCVTSRGVDWIRFVDAAQGTLQRTFFVALKNRARFRRKIAAAALGDWVALLQLAEEIDDAWGAAADPSTACEGGQQGLGVRPEVPPHPPHQPSPLCSFVQEQGALLEVRHALLGFELDLYSLPEFLMVFWYTEYLLTWLLQSYIRPPPSVAEPTRPPHQHPHTHDDNCQHHHQQPHTKQSHPQPANGSASASTTPSSGAPGNKKKKGGGDQSRQQQSLTTTVETKWEPEMTPEILLIQAQRDLCRAYVRFLVGLARDGRMPAANYQYGSEEMRFKCRFAPYTQLHTPPHLSYATFVDDTDPASFTAAELYLFASDSFKSAKLICDRAVHLPRKKPLPEHLSTAIHKVAKVAVSNSVSLQLILNTFKRDEIYKQTTPPPAPGSLGRPKIDFSVHKSYPVITLPAHPS